MGEGVNGGFDDRLTLRFRFEFSGLMRCDFHDFSLFNAVTDNQRMYRHVQKNVTHVPFNIVSHLFERALVGPQARPSLNQARLE